MHDQDITLFRFLFQVVSQGRMICGNAVKSFCKTKKSYSVNGYVSRTKENVMYVHYYSSFIKNVIIHYNSFCWVELLNLQTYNPNL